MADKNYNYETKCRRCGYFTTWHFSSVDKISWLDFCKTMIDYIQFPRDYDCPKCKKSTVQDVVAYSQAGGE